MARARGGDERCLVRALVETESGFGQGAAQALREFEGKTLFLFFGVIEQRGERGIDARVFRITRNFGFGDKLDLRGRVVLQEVLFDRGEIFQLLRILAFFREIMGDFRRGGTPLLDDFRIALHADARAEGLEVHARKSLAMEFAQTALVVMEIGRSEQSAGHAADTDGSKVPLGWFDLDGFGAVEVLQPRTQNVPGGIFLRHPHAAVGTDMERSLRRLGRGTEVDRE